MQSGKEKVAGCKVEHAEEVGDDLRHLDQPDWVKELARGGHGHDDHAGHGGHGGDHDGGFTSTRTTHHDGHEIEIKTTYHIKIDGKPYRGHLSVNDDGHLHCHAIPYETYGSALDFVRNLIDIYPDTFATKTQG